ncbi:MAG: ABC transporter substrate-binding protein [Synergistaceae bacterium]|jgi:peptide/nickel transport system substrate-binding protein|nr:ABC transporter substrate-binding protein [Synergistaceae bacterium]
MEKTEKGVRKAGKRAALFGGLTVLFLLFWSTGAVAAGKDTFVYANGYDIRTLDPITTSDAPSWQVCRHIYQTLIELDDDFNVVPELAEKYEILSPTIYRFYLKKGVRFHNGEEVKADDVVFSLERAISPAGSAVRTYAGDIESVTAVDEYTVDVRLKQASTPFIMNLTVPWAGILNRKAVEAAGEAYAQNPVGSGPFRFESWRKGDRVVLERFEDFAGPRPTYKTLIVRAIPEANIRAIELESGAVDLIYLPSTSDLLRLEGDDRFVVHRDNRPAATNYLGFNTQKPALNDPKVRRALAYGVNVPGILQSVFRKIGALPAQSPLPPGVIYFDTENNKVQEYNPEKGKSLLAEAGSRLEKLLLVTNERSDRQAMATIVQAGFKELGIDVEIQVLEWAAFLDFLKEGKHDLCILGNFAAIPDPHSILYSSFHSSVAGQTNYAMLKDPEVDELLEKGIATPAGDERKELYFRLQRLLDEKEPWVSLVYLVGTQLGSAKLEGVNSRANGGGIYDFRKISFRE